MSMMLELARRLGPSKKAREIRAAMEALVSAARDVEGYAAECASERDERPVCLSALRIALARVQS
jgi:hypothetical protein